MFPFNLAFMGILEDYHVGIILYLPLATCALTIAMTVLTHRALENLCNTITIEGLPVFGTTQLKRFCKQFWTFTSISKDINFKMCRI